MDRGYALVVGDTDGQVSTALAEQTQLHVISALTDEASASALREKLLAGTTLYGSRIHVLPLEKPDRLPFAQYFANAVVVAGSVPGLSGKELYRVLRPCGGIMLFSGLSIAETGKLIEETGALESEIRAPQKQTLNTEHLSSTLVPRFAGSRDRTLNTDPAIIRGQLPGALDWDSKAIADSRVKWPLRLLWFGGPGPAKVMDRKEIGSMVAANGRYFVMGENRGQGLVTAVDAYNGFEYWTHVSSNLLGGIAAADANSVYVNNRLVLDAKTGAVKKPHAPGENPPFRRAKPQNRQAVKSAYTPRLHPLTGRWGPKIFHGTFGCSVQAFSEHGVYMRSGNFGIYDFLDDSGMRNFGGISPSCSQSTIAALGLLIASEGRGGCDCSYNVQTSLALAPAEKRLNEDWALFFDRDADTPVRTAAFNFGAPGDRRDEQSTLWLGWLPRPSFSYGTTMGFITGTTRPSGDRIALQAPLELQGVEGFAPYRFNADRTPVEGTERPWIYASGFRGLRKAVLKLNPEPLSNAPPRSFTVRLHFAEPDNVQPGWRVFDVKLQDAVVLKNFDVVREAGGPRKALVKEFKGVTAGDVLTLELASGSTRLTPDTTPIVCGMEVNDESFQPPPLDAPAGGKAARKPIGDTMKPAKAR